MSPTQCSAYLGRMWLLVNFQHLSGAGTKPLVCSLSTGSIGCTQLLNYRFDMYTCMYVVYTFTD